MKTKNKRILTFLTGFVALSVLLTSLIFILNVKAEEPTIIYDKENGTIAREGEDATGENSLKIIKPEVGEPYYLIDSHERYYTFQAFSHQFRTEGMVFEFATATGKFSITNDAWHIFTGIGNAEYFFEGTLRATSGIDNAIEIPNGFLFSYLSTKATIGNLQISNGGFAEHLVADGDADYSGLQMMISGTVSATSDAGALFGRIEAGTATTISLALPASLTLPTSVTSTGGHAGVLIGEISSGVTLNLSGLPTNVATSVTAKSGAGTIVGSIAGTLNLSGDYTLTSTATVTGATAGGFAGAVSGTLSSTGSLTVDGTGKTIFGTSAAGGFVGSVSGSIAATSSIAVSGTTVKDGVNAGGFAGEIDGSVAANGGITVSGNTVTGTTNAGGFAGLVSGSIAADYPVTVTGTTAVSTSAGGNTAGGFIGNYTGTGLPTTVSVTGCTVSTAMYCGGYIGQSIAVNVPSSVTIGTTNSRVTVVGGNGASGGIFGQIDDRTGSCTVSAGSVFVSVRGDGFSGGLIGKIDAKYVLCSDIAFTLNNSIDDNNNGSLIGQVAADSMLDCHNLTVNGDFTTRRAIGQTGEGAVVRLHGSLTYAGSTSKTEYIVGAQDGSLIYCEAEWTLTRNTTAKDDIGNYGQIIRNDNIIVFDSDSVTIAPLTSLTVSSVSDFAKLAIYLTSHGKFKTVNIEGKDYTAILASEITISGDIDLTGTGIESLTRTSSNGDKFSGTIKGGSHTVTLDIGTNYPDQTSGNAGTGYNSRPYAGLFSAVDGATFENLTVAGKVMGSSSNTTVAGGLAGAAAGTITVTSVTSKVTITGGSVGTCGGLFGTYEGTALSITNSTSGVTATAGGIVGGFVGTATMSGTNPTIDFSSSTFNGSLETSATEAKIGGFIATVSSTAEVTVTMNSVTVTPPTDTTKNNITATASGATSSGGLIGYNWGWVNVTLTGSVTGSLNVSAGTYGGLFNTVSGKVTIGADNTAPAGTTVSITCGTNQPNGLVVYYGQMLYLVAHVNDITFTVPNGYTGDYLVGTNIEKKDKDSGIATSGGIVTIETGAATRGSVAADAISAWNTNANTRYYYNVEGLVQSTDGASQLLLWHITNYARGGATGINGYPRYYFGMKLIKDFTATSDMDMSGKCLYPTNLSGNRSIELAGFTLTFGIGEIKGNTTESSQNYGMQTGLLLNVTGGNLTVDGGTDGAIKGEVSKLGANSGALILGTVSGSSSSTAAPITVIIKNLTLTGLKIAGYTNEDYAPLLVNKIGTNIGITFDTIYDLDGNKNSAATLIGAAGSTTAKNLDVIFANMVLRSEAGKNDSPFYAASFLYSIQYASGKCVYNFNANKDWVDGTVDGTYQNLVTYGSEMGSTTQYYDKADAVQTDTGNKDFSNWLVYVKMTGDGYRVISVNVKGGNLLEGYGTYAHPYVIHGFNQLFALARYLNTAIDMDGRCDADWQVNYPATQTVKYFTESEYTAKTVKGNEKESNIRAYLQGAYYLIQFDGSDETPSTGFVGQNGIGTTATPFQGVIIGANNANTITITDNITAAGFGFVNVANGCVIKNLTIEYSGTITVSSTANSYFGGVIGTVKGGDNIIDGVSVTFTTPPTTKNKNAYVGGYVGLIQKGGVIFRSMSGKTGITATGNFAETSTYYYANPIIGRVLDGYAVSDDAAAPDNTDKNYTIVNIDKTNSGVAISGSAATITSANGLLIFSAAWNSGSLLKYSDYGVSRTAAYENIGTIGKTDCDENKTVRIPYLAGLCGITVQTDYSSTAWSIALPEKGTLDLSGYGNGFRGLGASYDNWEGFKIAQFNGNGCSVKIKRKVQQVNADIYKTTSVGFINYLNVSAATTISDLTVYGEVTFDTNGFSGSDPTGAYGEYKSGYAGGLIGATNDITNKLTIKGVNAGGGTNQALTVTSDSFTGGIIGLCRCELWLEDCTFNNLSLKARHAIGGFVGAHNPTAAKPVTVNYTKELTCSTLAIELKDTTNATGFNNDGFGGLIGWSGRNITMPSNSARLTLSGLKISISSANNNYTSAGGVVGHISGFGTNTIYHITVKDSTVEFTTDNNGVAGGIVGGLHRGSSWSDCGMTISGCTVEGTTTITGKYCAGGIIGLLKSTRSPTYRFENCSVSGATVTSSNKDGASGGIFGLEVVKTPDSDKPTVTFNGVTVSGCSVESVNGDAGGLIGSICGKVTLDACGVGNSETSTTVKGNTNVGSIIGEVVQANKDLPFTMNKTTAIGVTVSGGNVGVIGNFNNTVAGNAYINELTIDSCAFTGSSTAGGVCGSVTNCTVYGNLVLWKGNTLTATMKGVFIGKLTETTNSSVKLLGVSRFGGANDLKDACGNNAASVQVVYASYGAANAGGIAQGGFFNPSMPFGNKTLYGEAFNPAAGYGATLNDLSWWGSKYTTDTLKDHLLHYSDLTIGGNAKIPVFYITGQPTVLKEYLNLLTNGGYESWGSVTVSSEKYTITVGEDETIRFAAGGSGSVTANGKDFTKSNSFDMASEKTLTIVTVTFTNQTGSGEISYSMQVAVYFPQILAYYTTIIPMSHEEHNLLLFTGFTGSPFGGIAVNTQQTFTMYIEFLYNDVYKNIAFGLDKTLVSSVAFPVGTKLMLIDLNTGSSSYQYGKVYTLTVGVGGKTEIKWSDFGFTGTNLQDLPSGERKVDFHNADAAEQSFGIERYLLLINFPATFKPDDVNSARSVDMSVTATAPTDNTTMIERNCVTTEKGTETDHFNISVWSDTTVKLEVSATNNKLSQKEPLRINVNIKIQYPGSYATQLHNSGQIRKGSISYYLQDATGNSIALPVGTVDNMAEFNRKLNEQDLLTDPTFDATELTIDFSGVDSTVYSQFITEHTGLQFFIVFYLTDNDNPNAAQSGILEETEIGTDLVVNRDVPLTMTVTSGTDSLGINKYDGDKGKIEFTLQADLTNVDYLNTNYTLKLAIQYKGETKYVTLTDLSGFALTTSTGESVGWQIDNPNKGSSTVTLKFILTVDPDMVANLVNHKLVATLYENNNQTLGNEVCSDYFIFTVSDVYTKID